MGQTEEKLWKTSLNTDSNPAKLRTCKFPKTSIESSCYINLDGHEPQVKRNSHSTSKTFYTRAYVTHRNGDVLFASFCTVNVVIYHLLHSELCKVMLNRKDC